MNKEIKNKILEYIDEIKSNNIFWEKTGSKNLGSTNIRNMATIALNADCYKELELYIAYKIARGNGWEKNFKDNKKFGEIILEYMDKIKKLSDTEEEALSNISKFFGYLYWFRKSIEKGGK
ncbi:hypothetical protein [Defluviitalea phaphyphila]|uniref:hypothetical protein n=1 Tax=Defluviitalea phaphyphila TaxID=1473580 RepID=UPI001FA729E7|nr:hypothetical protein [Defluviitalea phaphyphila]